MKIPFFLIISILLIGISCSDDTGSMVPNNDVGTSIRCSSNSECGADEYCDPTISKCVKKTVNDAGGKKVCNPGDKGCYNQYLSVCNEEGTEWIISPCPSGEYCENGECTSAKCIPGERQCTSDGKLQICNATTKKFDTFNCPQNTYCLNNVCINVICTKGETRCSGDGRLQTCNDKGTGFITTDCPKNQVCDLNSCRDIICKPDSTECSDDGMFLKTCNRAGTEWESRGCGAGYVCDEAGVDNNGDVVYACLKQQCLPTTKRCSSDRKSIEECDEKGANYKLKEDCEGKNAVCINNQCIPRICQPMSQECDTNNINTLKICNEYGTEWNLKGCGAGMVCVGNSCVEKVCSSGYKKCEGNKVMKCNDTGTGFVEVEECTDPNNIGNQCINGRCMTLCEKAEVEKSYIGCEYWPADLPQTGEYNAQQAQFAIVVSNPNDKPATATLYKNSGQLDQKTVPAKGLATFLPDASNSIEGHGRSYTGKNSYRLTSTIPVAVYQFNPYNNDMVYSNDASLLVPTAAMGIEYFVLARDRSFGWYGDHNESLSSYAVIIATQPGTTNVTIRVSAHICSGGSISDMPSGTTRQFVMNQWDVLDFEACDYGSDMTGTYIVSDKPIAVYGGTGCSQVPTGVTACDHLEMQMFPVSTWGNNFIATKYKPRGTEPDYWRFLAAYDNTVITTNPVQPGTPKRLNRGQFYDFSSKQDFEVYSTKPILLGQYMAGEDAGAGTGDPSMSITPPIEQYRTDYIFLVPANYNGGNFVNITAPAGSQVVLDGAPVSGFVNVGSGKYVVAKISVSAGTHTITADKPVGITVHGYDQYVSYAYPGGLNLIPINK